MTHEATGVEGESSSTGKPSLETANVPRRRLRSGTGDPDNVVPRSGELGQGRARARLEDQVRVRLYLPESFVAAYDSLASAAHGERGKGKTQPGGDTVAVARNGKKIGPAKEHRKLGYRYPLGSDEALAKKAQVDRELRAIARRIFRKEVRNPEKCPQCGRFGEETWLFCANCGVPLR